MGGSESKSTSSDHEILLNEEDRRRANARFNEISHGQKSFTKEQFIHFTSHLLDSFISSRLFDLFLEPLSQHGHQRQHHHNEVNHHNFVSHVGIILNGSTIQKANVIVYLASIAPLKVSATDLVTFVSKIMQCYERLLHAHCATYQSWMFNKQSDSHKTLAVSLLADLLKSGNDGTKPVTVSNNAPVVDPNLMFTDSDVEVWLSKCPFFQKILDQSFLGIFQYYESLPGQMKFSPRIPQVQETNWSRCSTILDFPSLLFVNHALPTNLQSPWKLLFSNHTHGGSYSQLLKHIRNQGPTIIVVRDEQGHVFGGFASTSWDVNPKFQGNSECFLFQTNPHFAIYQATGYNSNFMYLNHNVQTLPNGVGMGGQFYYYGLWIDQSFDNGHSKAGSKGCLTYGSPQLSASPEFKVDTLEVWGLGKRKEEDDGNESDETDGAQSEKKGKSILDKLATEDRAILDMVDRGTISDAIRAEPEVKETAAHNTIISPF